MRGQAAIDYDAKTARLELTLEAIEDGGAAIEAVKGAARALWPDIVFSDEPGFPGESDELGFEEEDEAEAPPRLARKPFDFSSPPAAGTFGWQVLQAAKQAGSVDVAALAAALGADRLRVAQALGKLRKGGHLAGAAPA
jgi:hypothetical protein